MSEEELFTTLDNFRDLRIWEKQNGKWILKDSIINSNNLKEDQHIEDIKQSNNCEFIKTKLRDPSKKEDCYTLLEKGYAL